MKLSFNMNADDYYLGFEYKMNKNNMVKIKPSVISIILLLIIMNVCYIILKLPIYTLLLVDIFVIVMPAGALISRKKTVKNQFNTSVILHDTHTIQTYDEGIEVINSYEKMFAPWQSIFAVKNTAKYLIVLPTYRKGVFVINKEQYAGEELDALIKLLQTKTNVEEGK